MKFKSFEIRNRTDIHNSPIKYRFELVKWSEGNSHCWTIAFIEFDKKDNTFEIRSVDLRYLEYREDGLEEWLIKWSELKKIEFLYDSEEEK